MLIGPAHHTVSPLARWGAGCVLALVAAACAATRPRLEPIPPARYFAAGDTAIFGRGPIAMDEIGRLMRLELREDACVLLAKMDRQNVVTLKEVRRLPAGVHDIPPWQPDALRGSYQRGQEALLVLVLGEECSNYQPDASLGAAS